MTDWEQAARDARELRRQQVRAEMARESPGTLAELETIRATFGGLALRSWSPTSTWPGGTCRDPWFDEARERERRYIDAHPACVRDVSVLGPAPKRGRR
jgi:hypothetical protein